MDKAPVREACEVCIPQKVVWWVCGTGDIINFALARFGYEFLAIIFADGFAECVFSHTPLEYKSVQTQCHLIILNDP
jgi:hypothetical protein